jgi:hypothetical protein
LDLLEPEDVVPIWKQWTSVLLSPEGLYGTKPASGGNKAVKLKYHVGGSRLQRFAWFRRKQALHLVHHRHADSNFAVIDFFCDRILGTDRRPDPGA